MKCLSFRAGRKTGNDVTCIAPQQIAAAMQQAHSTKPNCRSSCGRL
jgi:hypothetical protein